MWVRHEVLRRLVRSPQGERMALEWKISPFSMEAPNAIDQCHGASIGCGAIAKGHVIGYPALSGATVDIFA